MCSVPRKIEPKMRSDMVHLLTRIWDSRKRVGIRSVLKLNLDVGYLDNLEVAKS
jgi:hypothetical protein